MGLIVGLAGYFGPWVWHPAVGLRLSADDLAEFVKFMPVVQLGELSVTRELFFVPIWLASLGVALWMGAFVRQRWVRAVCGILIVYASIWPMPPYPFILDAYRSHEFGLSFWVSVATALACVAALVFGTRLTHRQQSVIWSLMGLSGATLAPLAFVQVKPAIEVLYNRPITVGWGIAAVMIGLGFVALIGILRMRIRSKDEK